MKWKLKLYKIALEMIIRDRDKVFLTGKQKSQFENLIRKIDRLIK